jgi:hypothetical protein
MLIFFTCGYIRMGSVGLLAVELSDIPSLDKLAGVGFHSPRAILSYLA